MKIEVNCPCGREYSVPQSHVGRKIQCKKCGRVLIVEAEEVAPAPFSMAFVSMEDTGLPEGGFQFDDDSDDMMVPSNIGLLPSDSEVADFTGNPGPLARKTERAPVFQQPIPLPPEKQSKSRQSKRHKKKTKKQRKSRAFDDIPMGFDTPASEELLPDLTKTCPNCETVCPSDVRVCISCGYDFTSGRLLNPEAPEKRQRQSSQAAKQFAESLERLSWASLIPAVGLVLGPIVLVKSGSAASYGDLLVGKAEQRFRASVNQARLVAIFSTLIWAASGIFLAQMFTGQTDPRVVLRERRKQMKMLSAAVASVVRTNKKFPKKANTSADRAIDELSSKLPDDADLAQLQLDYDGRFTTQITADTRTSRWLFWERQSHEENGRDIHYVVRVDQRIEKIRSENFEKELQRAFKVQDTTPKPKKTGPVNKAQQASGFLAYFKETQGKTKLKALETAIKQPALIFLADAVLNEDLKVRAAALKCVTNIQDIPEVDRKRLLVRVYNSGDEADKYTVIKILQKAEDQDWLRFAGKLYKVTSNEESKAGLYKLLLAHFESNEINRRALLNVAVDLRANSADRPLFIPPKKLIPELIPLLSNTSYYNEILSIFVLVEDLDLTEPLKAAIDKEQDLETRVRQLKALLSVARDSTQTALETANAVLSNNQIQEDTRLEVLRSMMNLNNPMKVRIAAGQFSKARDKLRPIVLELFINCIDQPEYLPELIRTFDTEAASVTKEALQQQINDQLTESIALNVQAIENKRGILAIIDLIKLRTDPGSLKILKHYANHKDPIVTGQVFRNVREIKFDGKNAKLLDFMCNYAARLLRDRERNDSKKSFACKIMGEYQKPTNISLLKSFVQKTKSLTAAKAAIDALGAYNSMNSVKALLAISMQKRLREPVRSKAEQELRSLAGVRGRVKDLSSYVKKNRDKIQQWLDKNEANRRRKLNR